MQIQPTGFPKYYGTKASPNFKACYPVTHWVAETNAGFAPVMTVEFAKKLQGILVRFLNSAPDKYSDAKAVLCRKIKNFIASNDKSYNEIRFVRSFYDKDGGWKEKVKPVSYLITGRDAQYFEQTYGTPVGVHKGNAPILGGKPRSAELDGALNDYFKGGLKFVKSRAKDFCDANGMPYGLHAKYQVIRTRNGNIKEYKLVGLGYYPEEGPANPFVKLKYPPV